MITLKGAAGLLSSIHDITLETTFTFASLAASLKDDIILTQPATHDIHKPPIFLPPSVITFLGSACTLSSASVRMCWSALKDSIWAGNFASVLSTDCIVFVVLNVSSPTAQHTFYPPFKICQNATCNRQQNGLLLGKAEQRKAVYFSLHHGTVPAWSIQFYCESCKTTYHTNYKVVGDRRIYYDYTASLPGVVQIADHYFVDYQVAKLWKAMMHTSCTSATSCAHIYNLALAKAESTNFPNTKWFTKDVTMDHVWNAFIITSLLEDCRQHRCILDVDQRQNQSERFTQAMLDRNRRMRLYNQPLARRHFCSKCTRVFSDEGNTSESPRRWAEHHPSPKHK
ncbi:hypothetical protein EDD22DRAFT_768787 [Suillus occidentalis]|nr:hypothetical protein EDD22DRAFT_768787 [Suillus occidentalis]